MVHKFHILEFVKNELFTDFLILKEGIQLAIYGYIRQEKNVSTIDKMKKVASYPCDDVIVESTGYKNYDSLESLLKILKKDDLIVVETLQVFSKNIREFSAMFDELFSKGAHLVSLDDELDSSKPIFLKKLMEVLIKMDINVRTEKSRNSIEIARSNGVQLGRPAIDEDKITKIKYLRKNEKLTLRQISEKCEVSLGTVSKYIQ